MSNNYTEEYQCRYKATFINEKCPDNCFGDKCDSNNKCSNQVCKCLKKKRQRQNKSIN